jgi:hypothetical protein
MPTKKDGAGKSGEGKKAPTVHALNAEFRKLAHKKLKPWLDRMDRLYREGDRDAGKFLIEKLTGKAAQPLDVAHRDRTPISVLDAIGREALAELFAKLPDRTPGLESDGPVEPKDLRRSRSGEAWIEAPGDPNKPND